VSLDRAFDDDRWPSYDGGFACCFLCGRKVDPRDPQRGTYTPRADACEPLVCHISCAADSLAKDPTSFSLQRAAMQAVNQMGRANIRRAREEANVSIVSPMGV